MNIRTTQPEHLKKPIKAFCVGFLIYSMVVVATFTMASGWMVEADAFRPYVASIPGISLCGIFLLLFAYIRRNDELVIRTTTQSLAAGCVAGLCAHIVSISRSAIGGYAEFDGSIIIVAMTLAFLATSTVLTWKRR